MTAIAEAFVTLRPETGGFAREAKSGIAGAFGPIGKAAAAGMAVVGGVIAATAVKGVQAFASFERSMNEVFTLMPGITGEAMDAMSDQVLQFAKDFGTLPEEVVPALYQALSAGVPQDNVFEFLETAQKAAIAGVTDLETAVDGISSVVNAYGSDVLSAAEASDTMFTAVRLGKTDFTQLAQSLFNVIPTAAAIGVSFADVSAALATITAQGTPTTVATTQLRQMFVELSKDGSAVAEVFEDIHGKSFPLFIAEGGNVQRTLQLLEDHADDTGVSLSDLFSSVEAGNAALGLTGQATDAFASALEQMGTSAGATQDAYDQMDQGMSRAMDKLKAGWEVLKIHIGESLQPAVQAFANWVVENMPMIEEKITRFFQGVGLVAESVAAALFGAEINVREHLGGVNTALDQNGAALGTWGTTVDTETGEATGAFETIANFIREDFQPAFEGFKTWWNEGGGEQTFASIASTLDFIAASFGRLSAAHTDFMDNMRAARDLWRSLPFTADAELPGSGGGSWAPEPRGSASRKRFHTGGIFGEGQPLGTEGLGLLQAGEEILDRGDPRHRDNGGGGITVENVNVYNPAQADPGESVSRAIERLSLAGL